MLLSLPSSSNNSSSAALTAAAMSSGGMMFGRVGLIIAGGHVVGPDRGSAHCRPPGLRTPCFKKKKILIGSCGSGEGVWTWSDTDSRKCSRK